MAHIKKTGGARVGMFNATWPFATLKVNSNKLELSTGLMGNFIFRSNEIISIKPYGFIPIIGRGIKINHHKKSYNSKIIFWTLGSPETLIKEIEATQFFNHTKNNIGSNKTEEKYIEQHAEGFPIKFSSSILIIAIWNILLLYDFINFFSHSKTGSPLGLGTQLATGFILSTSILLLTSKYARKLILKKDQPFGNLKKSLYFIMAITGFLFLSSL